jgi:hypothetical protein
MVSKTQRTILERLARGGVITLVRAREPFMFWRHQPDRKRPRMDSVLSLVRRGYAESFDDNWRSASFRITQRGRELLADAPHKEGLYARRN